MVDGESKKDTGFWKGRNDQNKVAVFEKKDHGIKIGDYVEVKITACTKGTLLGDFVKF